MSKELQTLAALSLLLLCHSESARADAIAVDWIEQGHTASVQGVAVSPDGQWIASGAHASDSSAKIWDATTGQELFSFSDHAEGVKSVAFSPDGSRLVVGYLVTEYASTGNATVWDVFSRSQLVTLPGAGCFADISPDGTLVASGGGGVLRHLDLHRISDGAQLEHLDHGGWVTDVAFAPDGSLVASVGNDNTAKLWNPGTGALVQTLVGHGDDLRTVAFSPDGSLVATGAGGWDSPGESTIKIWNPSDGSLLRTLGGHDDWVDDVSFSPDSSLLISAGRDGAWPEFTYTIKLWRVSDGELLMEFDQPTQNGVSSVRFLPDGERIAFGLGDGSVVVGLLAGSPTAIEDGSFVGTQLSNYPNPFHGATEILFQVPASGAVRLQAYDLRGRLVWSDDRGRLGAGDHRVRWNGRDIQGRRLASGVYLLNVTTAAGRETRRVTLVR